MTANIQRPQSNFAYDNLINGSHAVQPNMQTSLGSYGQPGMPNNDSLSRDYSVADMSGMDIGGATSGPVSPGFTSMQDWFGGTNAAGESTMGYVPAGLGVAKFGLNAYLGMKNYGLAKDQLKFEKNAFNFNKDMSLANLENQSRTVNAELSDRQRARNIANPGQAMKTDEYMANYGVKGNV